MIEYFKRGWSSSTYHRFSGEIFDGPGNPVLKLEGKWNESAVLTDLRTGRKQEIWRKEPYPENWQYMYGMTRFCVNLNYLPKQLAPLLPPTDSRLRPD